MRDGNDWPPPGILFDFLHVALPAANVLEYRSRSEPLLTARGVSIVEWGLWNGPELFSMGLFYPAAGENAAAEFRICPLAEN